MPIPSYMIVAAWWWIRFAWYIASSPEVMALVAVSTAFFLDSLLDWR